MSKFLLLTLMFVLSVNTFAEDVVKTDEDSTSNIYANQIVKGMKEAKPDDGTKVAQLPINCYSLPNGRLVGTYRTNGTGPIGYWYHDSKSKNELSRRILIDQLVLGPCP